MPDPAFWTAQVRPRLAELSLNPGREAEIVEEIAQHLDLRYAELRSRGMSDAAARKLAIDELLEPEALADYMRPLRQSQTAPAIAPGMPKRSWLADFRQDLRYALRMVRRQPVFAAVAVLTLALGIGVNSAIFALVDATILRPLPFDAPDRLVTLWEQQPNAPRGAVAPRNLLDWSERNRTLERVAGFMPNVGGMVMTGADGLAETVSRQWVTAGFFDVLGVRAIAGRTFLADDETKLARVVVLSESFWRTRFGGDPGIIGRQIKLDGVPFTVVGVAPRDFQWIGRSTIWAMVPLRALPPRASLLQAVGRMKAGASIEGAAADMAAVAAGLATESPATNAGRGVGIEPLRATLIGRDLRLTSLLFVAVVGFVLLICGANVANLLLARASVRAREMAVRVALGADRPRLVRQLLTESLVLATLGGFAGLAVGTSILVGAPSLVPDGLLPPTVTLTFDARVVGFCAVVALVMAGLFGLVPAWQASRPSLVHAIASDSRSATGRGGLLRRWLVVGEVATAVLLLFGAGLLLRTLVALNNIDRGYRVESALTMMVDPLGSRYPTPQSLTQFFDQVERELRTVPGVGSVAWASTLPLGPSFAGRYGFEVVGAPPLDEALRPTADYQVISPAYFDTLDLPIVTGRAFTERDNRDSVPVCIVNEAFVRQHLNGRSALGQRIAIRAATSPQAPPAVREIVGVARQVKERPDAVEDLVQVYVPFAQSTLDDMYLIVRPESGSSEALAPAVRAAIGRVDREQLVSVRNVMTLDELTRTATARYRFRAVLVMTFAGLALTLAMVGVSGILVYSVQQRGREFGVRRAFGATTSDVLRLVALSALRVIAIGAAIGLGLSAMLSRLLSTMLFGVEPVDPMTFAFVVLVLATTAMAATAGPAWRAVRIDPADALRGE